MKILNSPDMRALRVKTEVVRSYYVKLDDWIYGGPFDTKEEAQACLDEARKIDAEHAIQ